MSGWYAMKRGWLETEIFRPKAAWSRAEAWIWLVENAAYAPTKIDIAGKPFSVPRGACCFSLRFLADKWKWSVKAVQTFLNTLERHEAIKIGVAKTGNGTATRRTLITLCNYDKYQRQGNKGETREKQDSDKEEQGNKYTNYVGASSPPAADLKKIIFDRGVSMLMAVGESDRSARAFLGKLVSENGEAAVVEAMSRTEREQAIDPKAHLVGCLRFQKKRQGPEPGWDAFGPISTKAER